jgi:NADPH2:quinone reductase
VSGIGLAVVIAEYGTTPSAVDWPTPEAGPNEALIEFEAAGLNPVDLAIGSGRFYMPLPSAPLVAGAEAVGIVVASARFPPGTRVWALGMTGCFAERFTIAEDLLVAVPDGVTPTVAAAMGIAGLAGLMPVMSRGEIVPGERVLILGASGIVGQVAVQAARAAGAGWIVAAARSGPGRARALAAGADVAIGVGDAQAERDLVDAAGDGIDLVVDTLWGEPVQTSLAVLRSGARVVQVGSASAPTSTVTGGTLRGKRVDIRGFSVFSEPFASLERDYPLLCNAAAAGTVSIGIDEVPLADASTAWEAQAHQATGRKLVLVGSPDA